MKIVFAPGFDQTEDGLTEEEIKEITAIFEKKIADGTLFEDAEPVNFDQLKEEDPVLYEALMQNIEALPIEGNATFEMTIQESSDKKPTLH